MSNIDFVLLPFLPIVVFNVIETSQFPRLKILHYGFKSHDYNEMAFKPFEESRVASSFGSHSMHLLFLSPDVRPCGTSCCAENDPHPRQGCGSFLRFKICVSPSMNSTVLNGFGYDGNIDGSYVAGISSRTNYSSVGWGGHGHGHGYGINLTSVREVFNKATLKKPPTICNF